MPWSQSSALTVTEVGHDVQEHQDQEDDVQEHDVLDVQEGRDQGVPGGLWDARGTARGVKPTRHALRPVHSAGGSEPWIARQAFGDRLRPGKVAWLGPVRRIM